ncbi:MAG TPA: hypothetical protein IAB57_02040 [Candidatus Fimivivens faecavium]|nr:hypothetical protein [Candidatus Fimivivens faecavium]
MKKLLSILMAIAVMSSAAVTSYAAGSFESAPAASASASIGAITGIEVAPDADGVVLEDGLLTPGSVYRFPIRVVTADGSVALDEGILESYNVKLGNTGKGESIAQASISNAGGSSYLLLSVKAGWPAEATEEQYSIKITKKGASKDSVSLKIDFKTGYKEADSSALDNLSEGDEVEVNNDAPVYTADQLAKIAKINRYRKSTFSGEGWTFTANINDMKAINMLYNNNPVKEILTKYEDNNFEFLTFPAGPKFNTAGEFVMDVSGIEQSYNGAFFVYRYLGGKLTAIPSAYSEDDSTLTFSTDTLGRFVITDKEIKDAVVIPDSETNSDSQNQNPNKNPATGVDPMSAMLGLSAAAMAAGAVVSKKKSR